MSVPGTTVAESSIRLAVLTRPDGRVEIRHFSDPGDARGDFITLSAKEREALAYALAQPGFHTVLNSHFQNL